MAAATAAQQAAKDTADQARLLALGGLIVGAVGPVTSPPWPGDGGRPLTARPDVALTGAGKV